MRIEWNIEINHQWEETVQALAFGCGWTFEALYCRQSHQIWVDFTLASDSASNHITLPSNRAISMGRIKIINCFF